MKQIATRLTALLLALVMTTTLALAANKSGYSDVPDKNLPFPMPCNKLYCLHCAMLWLAQFLSGTSE